MKKIETLWVYRLESLDPDNGLWYNNKAQNSFKKGMGILSDECPSKNLPMGYDYRYRQNGKMWFSSCTNIEDLKHWFRAEDAKKLIENGFVFRKYNATEWHEYDFETVFIKETSLSSEEVLPETIYGDEWNNL